MRSKVSKYENESIICILQRERVGIFADMAAASMAAAQNKAEHRNRKICLDIWQTEGKRPIDDRFG